MKGMTCFENTFSVYWSFARPIKINYKQHNVSVQGVCTQVVSLLRLYITYRSISSIYMSLRCTLQRSAATRKTFFKVKKMSSKHNSCLICLQNTLNIWLSTLYCQQALCKENVWALIVKYLEKKLILFMHI